MCFDKYASKSGEVITAEYADKDIKVYKCIRKNGQARYRSTWQVDGKNAKWTPGYIYYETTPFASIGSGYSNISVNGDALHSCKTQRAAMSHFERDCKIVEMIIPKGSIYYQNDTEYVSSALYYPIKGAMIKRGRPRKS